MRRTECFLRVGSALMLASLTMLFGCGSPKEPEQPAAPAAAPQTQAAQGGGSGGIQPLAPGAGAVSPVVGTESVQGGGSAAGSVMKDKARQAAANASNPGSAGSENEEGN